MFAGHITAPRRIELVDVPSAPPRHPQDVPDAAGEILFQPELACLCGSDLPYFEGGYPEFSPKLGQSLHEMIGVVAESRSSRYRQGDRVLCVPVDHFGLYEQYWVSARRAIPVDLRVSDEEAVLAQPLGTVLCAMRKLPNVLDWTVAIVGQGPMGVMFCAALRNLGVREIIAMDVVEDRLAASRKMGATATVQIGKDDPLEAVRERTGGRMADLVIELVGHHEQQLNLCVDLCRPQGTLLVFGVPAATVDGLRMKDLFWKNLKIITTVGPDFTCDFPLAMRWIAEGRIDVKPLATHRFGVGDLQKAFDLFSQRREGALKVFVDFRR